MAEQIKTISKFSVDAINIALNGLSEEEWKAFQQGLTTLTKNLGEKTEKKKNKPKTQKTDEEIFQKSVLPTIQQRVLEIEQLEMTEKICISVNFDIKTSFTRFSLEQMLTEHKKMVAIEEGLKSITLVVQFSRGLLYIELVDRLKKEGQCLRDFVESSNLNVSFMTVYRYITVATLISTYPRLILCQLSYSQILKHKTRLLHFLISDEGQELNAKLSLSVEIIAQGHTVKVERVQMEIPSTKFNTDPDWAYHDAHSKSDVTDEQLQTLVESRVVEDEERDLHNVM